MRRGPLPILLLVLAGALAFIGWRLTRGRPTARVTNALVLPARVRIDAGLDTMLAPGATLEWPLQRGTVSALAWELVPARTRGGLPVGAPMGGSQMLSSTGGGTDFVIRARSGGVDYFAPLITNETGAPLLVRINAGLAGAEECPCEIPPGARRAPIGYYRLYRNSTVEVRDAAGRRATFPSLGPEADPRSGAVGLRFNPGDLR